MTMLSCVSWLMNRPPSTGIAMATAATDDNAQFVRVKIGGNPPEIQLVASDSCSAVIIGCDCDCLLILSDHPLTRQSEQLSAI